MQNSNLYFTIFQKISEHLTILLNIQSKKKAGRPPKVSDLQQMSNGLDFLAENFEFIGDKGYKGYEYVKVCML
jgi:hypothetical protein